jgi:hypothetical protein
MGLVLQAKVILVIEVMLGGSESGKTSEDITPALRRKYF